MAQCEGDDVRTTTSYTYHPLEKGSVRLIRFLADSTGSDIRCSLEHRTNYAVSDHQHDTYTALSYCWGQPTRSKDIHLDGIPFPITENLWQALSTICLHHDTSKPFWIDAICINQADIAERNEQVSQMQQIFAKAGRTYVWLGPDDDHTRLAFEGLRKVHQECCKVEKSTGSDIMLRLGRLCDRRPIEHHQLNPRAAISVIALGWREYFSRVWIRPEYLQSKIYTLEILCGQYSIDAVTFNHALMNTLYPNPSVKIPSHIGELLFQRNAPSIYNECWPHTSPPYKFRQTLSMFARCGCTDPRDRIFAMIADPGLQQVCKPGEALGPDYRWTQDELILVVLTFYDTLLLNPEYNPNLMRRDREGQKALLDRDRIGREVGKVLDLLGDALGAPKSIQGLREWFLDHDSWTSDWEEKGHVVLQTGRVVECHGPGLDLLLNDQAYTGEGVDLGPDVITVKWENGTFEVTHAVG